MAHPFTKSVSLPLESKHLTYLLFVPLVQLISCLWYSAPVQCPAECPDSPCPFGLIMREDEGFKQLWAREHMHTFVSCKLLPIFFPDRVENECIHQLGSCRPHPKAELFCACKDTTSDKGMKNGTTYVILLNTFFSDKTYELGIYQGHQFCNLLVLTKSTNFYSFTKMKYFLLPSLAGMEWHFHIRPCVHSTWRDLSFHFS